MTEAEWLACEDPQQMVGYLLGIASDRKLLVCACHCWRRIWKLLSQTPEIQKLVDVTERYLNAEASEAEFDLSFEDTFGGQGWIGQRAWHLADQAASDALCAPAGWANWDSEGDKIFEMGQKNLAKEVRCIFGNLFRPATIDPTWFHWNQGLVRQIAQAIYNGRRFQDLPLLADALIDAGCTNQDIIDHCRAPGPHVRGCWVVDLLLEKS